MSPMILLRCQNCNVLRLVIDFGEGQHFGTCTLVHEHWGVRSLCNGALERVAPGEMPR